MYRPSSETSLSRQFDSEDGSSDGDITRSFGVEAGVSYELDLWGKLGHDYDAAKWETLATLEDRESTALSLIGTTATLYWQAVYYQQRLDIAQASIDYAQQTLDLVDTQYTAGSTSSLEVNEARSNLESQRAAYTEIEQNLIETKNALSILFNQPPSDIEISRRTLARRHFARHPGRTACRLAGPSPRCACRRIAPARKCRRAKFCQNQFAADHQSDRHHGIKQ